MSPPTHLPMSVTSTNTSTKPIIKPQTTQAESNSIIYRDTLTTNMTSSATVIATEYGNNHSLIHLSYICRCLNSWVSSN